MSQNFINVIIRIIYNVSGNSTDEVSHGLLEKHTIVINTM